MVVDFVESLRPGMHDEFIRDVNSALTLLDIDKTFVVRHTFVHRLSLNAYTHGNSSHRWYRVPCSAQDVYMCDWDTNGAKAFCFVGTRFTNGAFSISTITRVVVGEFSDEQEYDGAIAFEFANGSRIECTNGHVNSDVITIDARDPEEAVYVPPIEYRVPSVNSNVGITAVYQGQAVYDGSGWQARF